MSRRHLAISFVPVLRSFCLYDLRSTNGTYVRLVGPYDTRSKEPKAKTAKQINAENIRRFQAMGGRGKAEVKAKIRGDRVSGIPGKSSQQALLPGPNLTVTTGDLQISDEFTVGRTGFKVNKFDWGGVECLGMRRTMEDEMACVLCRFRTLLPRTAGSRPYSWTRRRRPRLYLRQLRPPCLIHPPKPPRSLLR